MRRRHLSLLAAAAALPAAPRIARAADTVRVAVFNVASALPFHVAQEWGLFAEQGIQAVQVPLQTPPLIVQAMITGDVDAASNLVTLEGANIDLRRPGTVLYFSLNGQNAEYRMESVLVRQQSAARTLADLRGMKIASAPGPANMAAARAVFRSVGMEDGRDYTLTEQAMGLHAGGLAAGTFDAAYTLEPVGTVAIRSGVARLLEAGVIATHLLGRPEALAFAAGGAMTERFLSAKPEVARRYAAAWAKAIELIRTDPNTRRLLVSHMGTSAEVAEAMPMQRFGMVRDLSAQDLADFQKFVDLAVAQGVLREALDVRTMLRPL